MNAPLLFKRVNINSPLPFKRDDMNASIPFKRDEMNALQLFKRVKMNALLLFKRDDLMHHYCLRKMVSIRHLNVQILAASKKNEPASI